MLHEVESLMAKHHASVNNKGDNVRGALVGWAFDTPISTLILYQYFLDVVHDMYYRQDLIFTIIIYYPL